MKLIIEDSPFGEGERIISVRPDFEKVWNSVPIGKTLNKHEAETVREWLDSSIDELSKIIVNLQSIEEKERLT